MRVLRLLLPRFPGFLGCSSVLHGFPVFIRDFRGSVLRFSSVLRCLLELLRAKVVVFVLFMFMIVLSSIGFYFYRYVVVCSFKWLIYHVFLNHAF